MLVRNTSCLLLATSVGLSLPSFAGSRSAEPERYEVALIAGEGREDGTEDPILVRLYSATTEAWSDWARLDGLRAAQSEVIVIRMAAGSTRITDVEVALRGRDDVVLTLDVSHPDTPYDVTPIKQTLQNTFTFEVAPGISEYHCDAITCSCDFALDCYIMQWVECGGVNPCGSPAQYPCECDS
ncbi:MAG: hypothetical protein AAGA48_09310 [Myxococcota bacterium]